MTRHTGDMFSDSNANVLLVTTNEYIRNDGCLVMGRGAAYQMTQKYKGCAKEFGDMIKDYKVGYPNCPYCLLISTRWSSPQLGIFQVKYHFRDEADLPLINSSAMELTAWASRNSQLTFAVNFPGIGNGRLREKDVLPLLYRLPDNVEVWTYAASH